MAITAAPTASRRRAPSDGRARTREATGPGSVRHEGLRPGGIERILAVVPSVAAVRRGGRPGLARA